MPKLCSSQKQRYNPYQQSMEKFKCNIDACGEIFPYKSVLQVHQIKNHLNDSRFKQRKVAIVKPFSLAQRTDKTLAKQAQIIIKDILAKEHYIVDEHAKFTCPVCGKSTSARSMPIHLYAFHKSLTKHVKMKVKCSDCSNLVHPQYLTTHKRTSCKGVNQMLLTQINCNHSWD